VERQCKTGLEGVSGNGLGLKVALAAPIFADSQLPHDPGEERSGCLLCRARMGFRDNRLPLGITPLHRQSTGVPRDTPHSTCFISRHGRDLLS
jgi:hypothetical protein